jgi:hypothetical protein
MIVLDDVLTSFTNRKHSHRSSWPRMQRCMLDDTGIETVMPGGDLEILEVADTWFVSHGMEFRDAYNLNSGWLKEHRQRLQKMIELGEENIVSLERPMPDLRGLLEKRAEKTDENLSNAEWGKLDQVVREVPVMEHVELVDTRRVVLGDSHSVARYRRESLVLRNDGLTLHGMLKRGIKNILADAGVVTMERLVIQAGNIDIRHHLMRQVDPESSVMDLMSELSRQLNEVLDSGLAFEVEVTAPYPIEFEGRKLPKTGYFKGAPFFGSWEQRDKIRQLITDEMKIRFARVYEWPVHWYQMDPEAYAEDFMEKPRSVHLSPEFHEWDYDWNRARLER